MPLTPNTTAVDQAFFKPLNGLAAAGLAAASPHSRFCSDFSDEDCLHLGIQRVIEMSESGRDFLQINIWVDPIQAESKES